MSLRDTSRMEMSFKLKIVRLFIRALSAIPRYQFQKSLHNPEAAQKNTLKQILKLAGRSELPESPTDYSHYPDNRSWTSEKTKFYETTSGNSGLKKHIPYTPSLLKSFRVLFLLWVDDILRFQNFKSGKLFISISPRLETLGLSSDLDYLSPFMQKLINPFLAMPSSEFNAVDGAAFFKNVAIRLLNTPDLECISIWSPSYLTSLLEFISKNVQQLEGDISGATMQHVLNHEWNLIWPNLKFISCWADGSSQGLAKELAILFPQTSIQGKGLLSTEAPITLPWRQSGGCIPLWTEVYLEYIDELDVIRPLYEIKPQQRAEILVSTHGGLLRYRLSDQIECTHMYEKTPVIKFIRRQGEVSDLVGEKLDSQLVLRLFEMFAPMRWILVPNIDHYVFVSDSIIEGPRIENLLCEIFHYKLARELGQLKSSVVLFEPNLNQKIHSYYSLKKIKVGDIKPRPLWTDSEILTFLKNPQSLHSSLL